MAFKKKKIKEREREREREREEYHNMPNFKKYWNYDKEIFKM